MLGAACTGKVWENSWKNHKIHNQLPVNKQLIWQQEGEKARRWEGGDSLSENGDLSLLHLELPGLQKDKHLAAEREACHLGEQKMPLTEMVALLGPSCAASLVPEEAAHSWPPAHPELLARVLNINTAPRKTKLGLLALAERQRAENVITQRTPKI